MSEYVPIDTTEIERELAAVVFHCEFSRENIRPSDCECSACAALYGYGAAVARFIANREVKLREDLGSRAVSRTKGENDLHIELATLKARCEKLERVREAAQTYTRVGRDVDELILIDALAACNEEPTK